MEPGSVNYDLCWYIRGSKFFVHFLSKTVILNLTASPCLCVVPNSFSLCSWSCLRQQMRSCVYHKLRCCTEWPNSVEGRHLGFCFFLFSPSDYRLFVYLHGRTQATVASRDMHEGAGCTCRGLPLRASTWYLSKAVIASAPLPALPGIPSDANWTFHLSILKRLVQRLAPSNANGWVLSWHVLRRMAHVTKTTLSALPL